MAHYCSGFKNILGHKLWNFASILVPWNSFRHYNLVLFYIEPNGNLFDSSWKVQSVNDLQHCFVYCLIVLRPLDRFGGFQCSPVCNMLIFEFYFCAKLRIFILRIYFSGLPASLSIVYFFLQFNLVLIFPIKAASNFFSIHCYHMRSFQWEEIMAKLWHWQEGCQAVFIVTMASNLCHEGHQKVGIPAWCWYIIHNVPCRWCKGYMWRAYRHSHNNGTVLCVKLWADWSGWRARHLLCPSIYKDSQIVRCFISRSWPMMEDSRIWCSNWRILPLHHFQKLFPK